MHWREYFWGVWLTSHKIELARPNRRRRSSPPVGAPLGKVGRRVIKYKTLYATARQSCQQPVEQSPPQLSSMFIVHCSHKLLAGLTMKQVKDMYTNHVLQHMYS